MNRKCLLSAAACLLSSLFAGTSARADLFDIDITGGATVAVPTGLSESNRFIGARMALGVRRVIAGHHAVGGQVRGHFIEVPWSSDAWNATASYRYFPTRDRSANLFGGLSAGVGFWSGCVRGDYCGGRGPIFGAEVGSQLPVNEDMAFTLGVELAAQLGLVNGVGAMMMPTAWAGIAF
jgi:hypothetical protein